MRSRSIPFWLSALIHLTVVGIAALGLVKPVEFAMDAGRNSVEVNLVAAEPDPTPPTPPPQPDPIEPIPETPPKPDDVVVPVAPPVPPTPVPTPPQPVQAPPPVVASPKPHHITTVAKGDGSAPKPGKDATTASSEAGAIMDGKPDYLSNPPPIYPDASRRSRQEGLVVLVVIVNEEGRPDSIVLQATSGFMPLDESAITAVHKWRFRPASLGSIKVKSRVVIPVRFRLDQ